MFSLLTVSLCIMLFLLFIARSLAYHETRAYINVGIALLMIAIPLNIIFIDSNEITDVISVFKQEQVPVAAPAPHNDTCQERGSYAYIEYKSRSVQCDGLEQDGNEWIIWCDC